MPRPHLVRVLLIVALAAGVTSEDYAILERIAAEEGIFDILDWVEVDGESDYTFYLSEKNIRMLRSKYPY